MDVSNEDEVSCNKNGFFDRGPHSSKKRRSGTRDSHLHNDIVLKSYAIDNNLWNLVLTESVYYFKKCNVQSNILV